MKRWKMAAAVLAVALVGLPVRAAGTLDVVTSETEGAETKKEDKLTNTYCEGFPMPKENWDLKLADEGQQIENICFEDVSGEKEYWGKRDENSLYLYSNTLLVTYINGEQKSLTYDSWAKSWCWNKGQEKDYYQDVTLEYTGAFQEDGTSYAYGEQKVTVQFGDYAFDIPIKLCEITDLKIVKMPVITEYYEGFSIYSLESRICLHGMQVAIELDNERTVTMQYHQYDGWYDIDTKKKMVECRPQYFYSGEWMEENKEKLAAGDQEVGITFSDKKVMFPIKVKKVEDISIVKLPPKVVFYGDEVKDSDVNLEGMQLKVVLDGEDRIIECGKYGLWYDLEGNIQYCDVWKVYCGEYYNEKYLPYGTAKFQLRSANVTTFFDVTIEPYAVEKGGTIVSDKEYQTVLKDKQINKFTFTPTEDGYYRFQKTDDIHSYSCVWKIGKIYFDKNGLSEKRFMQAGKTYTLELKLWDSEESDGSTTVFKVEKVGNYKEIPIQAPTVFEASFSEKDEKQYYSFTPSVSGTYSIYSEGATYNFQPSVELSAGNPEYWFDTMDSNNYRAERGENVGDKDIYLKAYLQKGQKYIYKISMIQGVTGKLKINLKQEEEHKHTWFDVIYPGGNMPDCAEPGYDVQECSECSIRTAVLTYKDHTFGNYTIVSQPTIFAAGNKIRTCEICDYVENTAIPKLPATISMNTSSITLKTGQSTTAVKVSGLTEGDSVASWKSDKPKVAKADKNGKITAGKKTGTATITVTLKSGTTATVKVKVQKKKVAAKKIIVNKKNVTLNKKKSYKIKAELQPITASDKVKFTSNNKKVATVNAKGVVKAKKAGTAKITVKAGKKKVVVTVKVKR